MDLPGPVRLGNEVTASMRTPARGRCGAREMTMTDQISSRTRVEPSGQTLVITRILDAPPDLVFKAWTEPERVKCWWGPQGFTSPVATTDLRVGGGYLYAMRSPEGQDAWSTGVYREIVEPERIVATDSFSDAEGNVVPASHYGMGGDWPLELLVTVTFEEVDGRTKLTLRHEGFPDRENRDLAGMGWNQSFDKLEGCLAQARRSQRGA
jgi:uncharacterized protein YndB with AHSA1/START domain